MTQRAQIKTCPAGICLHLCNLRFIIAMGSAEWMPSKSQSAILMTLSINLRPRSPLDLLPCPAGRGVFENALLAAPQFVALPIGKRQLGVFLGDAIPKIFHELNPFSASKFEERCEFGVHDQKKDSGRSMTNPVCAVGFCFLARQGLRPGRHTSGVRKSFGFARSEALPAKRSFSSFGGG